MTETQELQAEIDALSREDMCRIRRYAQVGHKYFRTGTPLCKMFAERFKKLGGFSPEISKRIDAW